MMAPRVRLDALSGAFLPALALCGAQCGTRVVNAVDLGQTTDSGANPGVAPDGDLGVALDGGVRPDGPGPRTEVVWPNKNSSANSDPWLSANHDAITEMRPNVLVLDFYNRESPQLAQAKAQQLIDAIAESSRYHRYADANAPPFLVYNLSRFVDLTDHSPSPNWPYVSSTRVPINPTSGQFDTSALFSASFAANYAYPDPANPNDYLTLCELFERGIINEMWLEVGDSAPGRAPGLMLESKQVFDSQNRAVPGMFNSCTGYVCLPPSMPHCSVTARIAHLDPTIAGPGCDLVVRSIGFENMRLAIPYLKDNASDFFNDDFEARFATSFDSWNQLVAMGGYSGWCTRRGPACISYPNETMAQGTYPEGGTWEIDPFVQGCGNAHFPPNAQFEWDYANPTPVQSRCENYAMRNGPDGGDRTDVYTSAKDTASAPSSGDDCAGGWQIYLRQSIPGLGNSARSADRSPMKNWWPFLFY
jgi:hypothetical protein